MKKYEGYKIGKLMKFQNDPEIISFAGGLPSSDLFPRDFIKKVADECLKNNGHRVLQYSAVSGERKLKEAVIDYLKKDNIHINPENIIITSSGQHGLDMLGRLFLEPGDTVVTDIPTFGGALSAFDLEDVEYLSEDIEDDGSNVNGFKISIEKNLKKGKKPKFIYVVPDFQNPSGITTTLQKRQALLSLSREHGIPIVEDSPYRELRYKGEHIPSIFSLDENRGNVIGVYTFSKILCPGLRVGFNIGPPEVIEKFSFIKGANTLNTPKLNQDICTAFLRQYDLDAHFTRAREYYSEKLEFFLNALKENLPSDLGIEWTKPEGGLFLWLKLPENINTMELFYMAVQEKVVFVPGEVCYPKGYQKHNTLRMNFSYPTKKQIDDGIKKLSTVIKKYVINKK